MENAINCVALFSKIGSSIRDFSRKEKKSMIFQEKKKKIFQENISKKRYYPQATQRGSSVSYVLIDFLIQTWCKGVLNRKIWSFYQNSNGVITKMSLHDLLHIRDLLYNYSNINTNV